MITTKIDLTKDQKESLKQILKRVKELQSKWDPITETPRYVVAGMLRCPDEENGLDDPEMQFGLFEGEHAEAMSIVFVYARRQQTKE